MAVEPGKIIMLFIMFSDVFHLVSLYFIDDFILQTYHDSGEGCYISGPSC